MKKIIAITLILTTLLFIFRPLDVFADTSGYYTYTVSNGEATITGCDTTISGSVTIPSTLGGYPVTSIRFLAFNGCNKLASITIPDGVTNIEFLAFQGCTNLTSITIPDSVTSIGDDAFVDTEYYNNTSNWDNGVLYIDSSLIEAKTNLSGSYSIKQGSVCISYGAFKGCTGLTNITIPDSIISIEDYAFDGCKGLTSVVIPDSVISIGNSAFYNCTNLSNITIPDSVTSIGNNAFHLTKYYNDSVNWVNGILYINNMLIDVKTLDNNVEIKKGTVTIGDNAFQGCTNLTNIAIPVSVINIGDYAFESCTNLTSITIPDGVTNIGMYTFNTCINLTSVTIPDSVTSIGVFAFKECTRLTSITIPDSVTNVADNAFEGCTALKNQSNSGSSTTPVGAFSEKQITVTLNGKLISFDVQPANISGRVLVPVRAIFEALGATVEWNGAKNEVISTKDDITIKMYQDDTTMYKNGQSITLDVPAKNIDGRVLVPIRAISEAFGCNVDWDGGNSCVAIRTSSVNDKPSIDFDAKMQKGISYFNQGLYYEAIDEIQSFCDENWGVLTPEQQEIALDYLGKSKQNLADYHYNLGVKNYNKGLYYEAQKLFTECLKYYTANSAQWQKANDYLYNTNQKIKELEEKPTNTPNYNNYSSYYDGTNIPTYTAITGKHLSGTDRLLSGKGWVYKYNYFNHEKQMLEELASYLAELEVNGYTVEFDYTGVELGLWLDITVKRGNEELYIKKWVEKNQVDISVMD